MAHATTCLCLSHWYPPALPDAASVLGLLETAGLRNASLGFGGEADIERKPVGLIQSPKRSLDHAARPCYELNGWSEHHDYLPFGGRPGRL